MVIKFPCERSPPCTIRKEDILIIRDGEFEDEKTIQTKFIKLTLMFSKWLILHHLLTLVPTPLPVLPNIIFSLSKSYKSFLFCILLWVFILLWRLPCTCKNSVKIVYFSPVNFCQFNVQTQPETLKWGNFFFSLTFLENIFTLKQFLPFIVVFEYISILLNL